MVIGDSQGGLARFACVSHSHSVRATVEKPIPILSCTDLGIMSQRWGFQLEDLRINRNLSHMLGHLAATCRGDEVPKKYGFSATLVARLCGWQCQPVLRIGQLVSKPYWFY